MYNTTDCEENYFSNSKIKISFQILKKKINSGRFKKKKQEMGYVIVNSCTKFDNGTVMGSLEK